MEEKKVGIKKSQTPKFMLFRMQIGHLGKILSVYTIILLALYIIISFGAFLYPVFWLLMWCFVIVTLGLPYLIAPEFMSKILDPTNMGNLENEIVKLANTIGIITIILSIIALICLLVDKRKSIPLIVFCSIGVFLGIIILVIR